MLFEETIISGFFPSSRDLSVEACVGRVESIWFVAYTIQIPLFSFFMLVFSCACEIYVLTI